MSFDVVVIGEVLVEVSSPVPFAAGAPATLSFSGDALNAAAAAADAGATVALLTRVGDDELGSALLRHVERLGVDTSLIERVDAPNGVYFAVADLDGAREFVYVRRGSAASTLQPLDALPEHRVLLASGIAQAISESAAAAVQRAAEQTPLLVYDPNFRPRLTSAEKARERLAAIAPYSRVVTPSWPGDAPAISGDVAPAEGARAAAGGVLALGAQAVAVTRGREGVLVVEDGHAAEIPAAPAEALVDATGAGDVFAGTLAAALALGASVFEAAHEGVAAAARSLAGQGGTGYLTTQGEPA